jgi:hypothetical protein
MSGFSPIEFKTPSVKYEWVMIIGLSLTPSQESQLPLLTAPAEMSTPPSEGPSMGITRYRLVFTYPVERSNTTEDHKALQWLSRIYDEYSYFDIVFYTVVYGKRI